MFLPKTLMSAVMLSFPVALYPPLSEIIAPGHQWESFDTHLLFQVNSVNYKNATFAGTLKNGTSAKFLFQGQYSPNGNTVGWVVSYFNEDINNNVVGVWTGTVTVMPQPNKVRIPVFTMHWILANGYTYNITSGFEQFAIVG